MSYEPVVSRERLLAELARVDVEGWDGQAGRFLLQHVRRTVVRPQVMMACLTGREAAQAESTGWQTAWELLDSPYLRRTDRPMHVVWVAVRRAIANEIHSADIQTTARKSWRAVPREPDWSHTRPSRAPLSLERLRDAGIELDEPPEDPSLGPILDRVVEVMAGEGWERRVAYRAVEAIASNATRRSRNEAVGWRWLSGPLGLPQWQVRRLTLLLVGSRDWEGVVELAHREGMHVLGWPSVRVAVRSTLERKLSTPATRPLRSPQDHATPQMRDAC
jgi:hypothetical protein